MRVVSIIIIAFALVIGLVGFALWHNGYRVGEIETTTVTGEKINEGSETFYFNAEYDNTTGTVDYSLKPVTIRQVPDVFKYVFDSKYTVVSNWDMDRVYVLNQTEGDNVTKTYKVELIENARFFRALRLHDEAFTAMTDQKLLVFRTSDGRFSGEHLVNDNGEVTLKLKMES